MIRVAVSALMLVGALLLANARSSGEAVPARQPLREFPTHVGAWRSEHTAVLDDDVLNVLKVSDYLMRLYVDTTRQGLWLYIGYWETQRKGAQIHSPKNCLPGSGWEPLQAGVADVPLTADGARLHVNRYLVQKERERLLVFYWYQSEGRAIASEITARMQLVQSAVFRHRTDGAVVRLSSPVTGSIAETEQRLVAYAQALHPLLNTFLPE